MDLDTFIDLINLFLSYNPSLGYHIRPITKEEERENKILEENGVPSYLFNCNNIANNYLRSLSEEEFNLLVEAAASEGNIDLIKYFLFIRPCL